MRTERIITRSKLKQELKELRNRLELSRPLIEAQRRLEQVYNLGYNKRIEDEKAEAQAKASVNQPAEPSSEPTQDAGPADPQ